MPGQMPVGLKPVVQLIVVGRGVGVFMPAQMVSLSEEAKEGLDVVVDIRLDQRRPEAAFVLGVVDQQSRLGRPHGGQRRVVLTPEQVGGVLFDVPRVLWPFDSRDQGRVAGHRHGHGHPLVQGGEDDGLPAAARESGDGQRFVGRPGDAVPGSRVLSAWPGRRGRWRWLPPGRDGLRTNAEFSGWDSSPQASHSRFSASDAPASQGDAPLLLVFDGLAGASDVSVHVEDRRQGTPVTCRFVEERRDLEAGQDLQEELSEAVSAVLLAAAPTSRKRSGASTHSWGQPR